MERAQALVEQTDYATAAKFAQRAVDQAPKHREALELLATIMLELGDGDRAEEVRLARRRPSEQLAQGQPLTAESRITPTAWRATAARTMRRARAEARPHQVPHARSAA